MVTLWVLLVSVYRTAREHGRGLLRRIDRTYADYFFTFLRIKYFSNTALASVYCDSLTANGSVQDLAAGVSEGSCEYRMARFDREECVVKKMQMQMVSGFAFGQDLPSPTPTSNHSSPTRNSHADISGSFSPLVKDGIPWRTRTGSSKLVELYHVFDVPCFLLPFSAHAHDEC